MDQFTVHKYQNVRGQHYKVARAARLTNLIYRVVQKLFDISLHVVC
jgi:hypothetical protein